MLEPDASQSEWMEGVLTETPSIHHPHTKKVTIIFFVLILETEVTFF